MKSTPDSKAQQEQRELEKAHQKTLHVARHLVESKILGEENILKLTELRQSYISCLVKTDCESSFFAATN